MTEDHPLSTIQTYQGIRHIMPYGSVNEAKGHTWMHFYRCATCFEVNITLSSISDTPFAARLAPYVTEPKTVEESRSYLYKLVEKNALIVDYLFPTLNELAPPGAREWNTLESILTTPTYYLSLRKPEPGSGVEDAVVIIDKGPMQKAALAVAQTPFSALNLGFSSSLPHISSSQIIFSEPIKHPYPPTSATLPSGHPAHLVTAGREIWNGSSNRTTNPSHFAIKRFLQIHDLLSSPSTSQTQNLCVQKPLALAITDTPVPPHTDNDAASPLDTQPPYLAGILLEPLPPNKHLNEPEVIALAAANPELRLQWYEALSATLKLLHSYDPPLWYGAVDTYSIVILNATERGSTAQVALPRLTNFNDSDFNDRFTPYSVAWTPEGDLVALNNLLGEDGWLVAETKKRNGKLPEGYEWKRKDWETDRPPQGPFMPPQRKGKDAQETDEGKNDEEVES